jgi:hypothetical protein
MDPLTTVAGPGHHARCNGCSIGVVKLKSELLTGYGKALERIKSFSIMVARDGVEPPTPAFSVLRYAVF